MKNRFELFEELNQKKEYNLLKEIETLQKHLGELNSVFFISSNVFVKNMGAQLEELETKGSVKKEALSGATERAMVLARNTDEKLKVINELVSRLEELKSQYSTTEKTIFEIVSLLNSESKTK